MNEEILQKLYENATSQFDMPDFETFKADMQDDAKLSKFRDAMSQHYDIPEFEVFKSDLGLKKKDESQPVQGQEDLVGQDVAQDTTLDSEQAPTEVGVSASSSGTLAKFEDPKDPRNQSFIDKKLGMGFKMAASGIASIPTLITQSLFTAVASDEEMAMVNKMEPAEREDFINRVVNPFMAGVAGSGIAEGAGKAARGLVERTQEVEASLEQFETTMGQDVANGDFLQAGKRMAGELAQTVPSILQTMIPVIGLASVGAGAAGSKLRDIQAEGDDLSGAAIGNAYISGAAEAVYEKFTKGQADKILSAFGKGAIKATKEAAEQTLTSFWKELGYGVGGEILTEEATYLTDKAADYLFRGKTVEFQDALLEMVDIAMVSGVMGGVMSAGGTAPKMLHEKKVKQYIDKTIEGSKWTDLSEVFNQPLADGLSTDQIKIAGMPYSKAFLEQSLMRDVKSGLITMDDAKQSLAIFQKTQDYVQTIKNSNKPFTEAQLEKAVNLIKEKDKLQQTIDGTDKALVQDEIARSKVIDEQLANLSSGTEVIKGNPDKVFTETNNDIPQVVEQYKKEKGITNDAGEKIIELDIEQSKNIADEYDKMEHAPNDPEVKEAYTAMATETMEQYDMLEKAGYKVELYEGEGEPYANSAEMVKDLSENKHLYVFATDSGFGDGAITAEQRAENPLLEDSGITDVNGKPLVINDVFRFVHDAVGHGERGNAFGAIGEENAWDVHARMYSDKARRAMTTETKGQNSWVNFNKKMRNEDGSVKKKGDEGYLSVTERPFADQKIGLLPEWISQVGKNKETVKTEATPKKDGKAKVTTPKTVGEAIDNQVVISELGGSAIAPVEGVLLQDGKTVVVETTDGRILEVGNIDEMTDTKLSKLGIEPIVSTVNVVDDTIQYNGEPIQVVDKSIKRDNDGNVKSVIVRSLDGSKTQTVKGKAAEDIVYNNKLARQEQINAMPPAEKAKTLAEVISAKVESTKQTVKDNITNAMSALQEIAPDVTVQVFENDSDFDKAAGNEGAAAFYNPTTKTIGINLNKADGTTVGHEAFHAILTEKIKDDAQIQEITQKMVKALEGTLSPELNQRLNDFIQNYDGAIQSEEKLAELVGILANNYQKMPTPKKTIIKQWLERLAKVFGMKPFTDAEVTTVLNVIAKRLNKGETITEGDISALNVKVKVGRVKPAQNTRYSKVMDALQKERFPVNPNTKVRKNFPLKEIEGQNVSSTLSDKLFAGTMGTFKFLGGVGYPIITGRYWASDSVGAANKIVNESRKSKDGYRYLLPAIMSPSSHISNKNSTIIATELLKESYANGEYTTEDMVKQLRRTFKISGKKADLTKYQPAIEQLAKYKSVDKMMNDLQNLMVNDMTFNERKATMESILGQGVKTKYPTVGSVMELAKSLEEPMTSDAGTHDVITVIRTKGNLKTVETPKDDEFYHESYGFHVESDQEIEVLVLDGAYPLVDIIPEFRKQKDDELVSLINELETKLGTRKKGSKSNWDIEGIRTNLGRTHGLSSYSAPISIMETRFQKDKTLDGLVKEGKDAGFTNKEIRDFLKQKGYEVKDIDSALNVPKGNRELLDMFDDIKKMVDNNISDKNILKGYKTDKEKTIAKGYINRARGMTAEQAATTFQDAWDKAIADQKKGRKLDKNVTAMEDAIEKAMTETVDRQFVPKKILNNAGFENSVDFMVVGAGASSYAKNEYDKLYDKIYLGLTNTQLNDLDQIIHLERVIAVDENRADRGMPPVRHQGGMTDVAARDVLAKMKERLGDEAYNDLSNRANDYFQAYKDILKQMNNEGIITDATYEEFADVNYQPTEYIEYLDSLDGEFLVDELRKRESAPLSKPQIKSMNLGSEGSQITDSNYLLQRTLLTRAAAVFSNRLNSTFAAEFKKQAAVVEDLKAKAKRNEIGNKLTKAEQKIVDNFTRLQSKVRMDEIKKFNKKGQPKYKMEKENTRGFSPIYYYENGVANRIYMEDEFHAAFTDTQEQYLKSNAKEAVSLLSGQAAVTSIATGNNPAFFITNMPRDFMFTLTFSKEYGNEVISNGVKLMIDLTKGMGSALTRGSDFQKYVQYGGGMDYLALQGKYKGTTRLNRAIDNAVSQKNQDKVTRNLVKKWVDRWNLASEAGMRVAVFNKSIKNQLKAMKVSDINTLSESEQTIVYTKAVRSARELTDFNQGGRVVKTLNSGIPYLNAATQGTRAAIESTKKRPLETVVRMAQVVGYSTAAVLGLSMYLIGKYTDDNDEELKEMTRADKYFATIEQVSEYDLRNYFIIPLGYKDDKGNWRYLRMAKAQAVTPMINAAEHMQRVALANYTGSKYKGDLLKIATDAVRYNILPVDIGIHKRIPAIDATMAMTGMDGYTGNPLSWDLGKISPENEGIVDDRVEPLYKKFGELTGLSPLRFQSAMESFITTPSTNPYVGIAYALGNSVTPDGEPFDLGEAAGNIAAATVKRVIKSGSPYNVIAKVEERISPEVAAAERESILIEDAVKKSARKVKLGESTPKEILETFTKVYEKQPLMMDKAKNWFKAEMSKEKKEPIINRLKYERNKQVRAVFMAEYYGNILTGGLDPQEAKILKELKDEGAIDAETMQYYFQLFEQE
jgi:hypothetical protein